MKRSAIIAAGLLTACTTTLAEMDTRQPAAVYRSQRSAAALEECLARSLSWMGLPSIVRGESATTLAFAISSHTHFSVAIEPSGDVRTVRVRTAHGYNSRARRDIQFCANAPG